MPRAAVGLRLGFVASSPIQYCHGRCRKPPHSISSKRVARPSRLPARWEALPPFPTTDRQTPEKFPRSSCQEMTGLLSSSDLPVGRRQPLARMENPFLHLDGSSEHHF